jgi:hypothetical protein
MRPSRVVPVLISAIAGLTLLTGCDDINTVLGQEECRLETVICKSESNGHNYIYFSSGIHSYVDDRNTYDRLELGEQALVCYRQESLRLDAVAGDPVYIPFANRLVAVEDVLTPFRLYPSTSEAMKVCRTDSDCSCGVDIFTLGCFAGNRLYVDEAHQCPDFCTGIAGNFETKCVENVCTQVNTRK